ncbi:alkaline phosphatase [Marinilabiliaceae bacterium JC017]|nr:alkaline phosphatase [Marinilabiliaceae bacterium JC017]
MVCAVVLTPSCSDDETVVEEKVNEITKYKTPKYIFYFIGDGMANPQINLAEAALNNTGFRLKSSSIGVGDMNISKFEVAGMATTYAQDRYITGSAAAATALATGEKTTINTISKNGDRTRNIETLAEMARDKGMRVGIVSSVSIDHATPACFYAHVNERKEYYNIASQMASSKFDYFGGGYAKGNFPSKGDGDILEKMKGAGYAIATTREELAAVKSGNKCWAYNHKTDRDGALLYEIDRPADCLSLTEFTKKGIELLDNENGFFLMVEAGKVDWACHANDAVSATHNMIEFDNAIGEAIAFYNAHPEETLIVLTGDHECGGLSIGFAGTGYENMFDLLKCQKLSYEAFTYKVKSWQPNTSFENALDSVELYFGLRNTTIDETLALSSSETQRLKTAFDLSMTDEKGDIYGGYDPFTLTITHILNNKAGLAWTSFKHTGVPVPVMAMGQGQYEFSGYYDNTDIAKKIMKVGALKVD